MMDPEYQKPMTSTGAKPSLAVRTSAPAKLRGSADAHSSNSPSPASSSSSSLGRRKLKSNRSNSTSSSSSSSSSSSGSSSKGSTSIRFSQDLSAASPSSSLSGLPSPQASAMARAYDSHASARQPADEAQLGSVALAADGAAFVLSSPHEPQGLGQGQGQGLGHLDGLPLPLQDLACAVGEAVEKVKRMRVRVQLGPAGKRLLSGAIAGGVSRTVVAPLETIRTHLMVGSTEQKSVGGVFHWIMETEGWKGLFRGNGINVLRVAPSKAIELYTYDTIKKALTPKHKDDPPILPLPFPVSSIAGSCAGIASCMLMYPLELVKTRLTVQKGTYTGIRDAFTKIVQREGFLELYRGLFASIVGVIPYAGANYFAYDTLCTFYKKVSKKKQIGHLATLLIGSSAGAFAASATFPLEVARKQMQMGALNGRVVYRNTVECMLGILKEQGPQGLYRGLAPSCIKLVPAAGISFMCYEALKRLLLDEDGVESRHTKKPI